MLEPNHVLRANTKTSLSLSVVGWHCQVGADVIKIVLNLAQPPNISVGQIPIGDCNPKVGGQLIHIAICLDSRICFANSTPVTQVRLATVSRPRVDACKTYRHVHNLQDFKKLMG